MHFVCLKTNLFYFQGLDSPYEHLDMLALVRGTHFEFDLQNQLSWEKCIVFLVSQPAIKCSRLTI